MAIDYRYKPGETPEQYNARIAAERAAEASGTPISPEPFPNPVQPQPVQPTPTQPQQPVQPQGGESRTNPQTGQQEFFDEVQQTWRPVTQQGQVSGTEGALATQSTITTQPQSYIVQPGDTISQIARRLNVPETAITGYRSGNPSVIFPGENLSVAGIQGQGGTQPPPTGETTPTGQPEEPGSDLGDGLPEDKPQTDYFQGIKDLLTAYGITPPDPNKNPLSEFAKSYKQLYVDLGLPDIKAQYESIVKQYDDLDKEQQDKIIEINDNPWLSESLRQTKVNQIKDKYQARKDSLTKQLTLYQGLFEKGQQEAQFIAGKGLELTQQGQDLNKDILFKAIDQAEKEAAARKPEKPTSELQEYLFAVDQGFDGTFLEYKKSVAEAGRKPEEGVGTGVVGAGFEGVTPSQLTNIARNAANLVGSERGKTSYASITNALNSGDYVSAYAQIGNNVEDALTGEGKTKFSSARTDYAVMEGLRGAIQAYVDAGGKLGYLKGTADSIARRFGQLKSDPKFASLAVQLEREFQAYRNAMTGAAFSPGESAEYAKVNPRANATLDLNLATINGALNQLENRITSTIETRVPGSKKIYKQVSGSSVSEGTALDDIGVSKEEQDVFSGVVQSSGNTGGFGQFFGDLWKGMSGQ